MNDVLILHGTRISHSVSSDFFVLLSTSETGLQRNIYKSMNFGKSGDMLFI